MSTTETGWTKEFPSLKGGNCFWLRNAPYQKEPHLKELNGGYRFYEPLGVVGPETEYLGPVTVSDFEQLAALRKATATAITRLDTERKRLCGYCEQEERWGHLWDATALDHVFNREGDKFNGQRLECRAKEIQLVVAALREVLGDK